MPSPIAPEAFFELAERSRLVTAKRLESFRGTLENEVLEGTDSKPIAEAMVRQKVITKWQADQLLAGKHKGFFLGKYRIQQLLGRGGMSRVFLAQHELMGQQCAIKVMPAAQVGGSSTLARFVREVQAVASLNHPNIVRAHDFDTDVSTGSEVYYFVMEYVVGKSLQQLGDESGALNLLDAADYIRQAAAGLHHAHENELVHRDIKPGNLLVNQLGIVKILDLGLVRTIEEGDPLTMVHDDKLLGTVDYLAPEQARDSHKVDRRADLYSLGCTLHFLLTGKPPFFDSPPAQRLTLHQNEPLPPLSKVRADAPASLQAILTKLTEKSPSDRYATAHQAALALGDWLLTNADDEWKGKHPASVTQIIKAKELGDAEGSATPDSAVVEEVTDFDDIEEVDEVEDIEEVEDIAEVEEVEDIDEIEEVAFEEVEDIEEEANNPSNLETWTAEQALAEEQKAPDPIPGFPNIVTSKSQPPAIDPSDFVVNTKKNVEPVENIVEPVEEEVAEVAAPIEDEVESIEDEVEPIEDDVEPIEDEVEPIEDDVEPIEDDVESIEDDVEPIEEAHAEVADPIEDEIEPIEDEIEPIEDDIESIEDDVEPIEDDVEPIEDEVEPIEDDVEPIEDDVEAIEDDVEAIEEIIEPIDDDVEEVAEIAAPIEDEAVPFDDIAPLDDLDDLDEVDDVIEDLEDFEEIEEVVEDDVAAPDDGTVVGRTLAVGIDLGTTYSVVAHLDTDGRPWTVLNGEGDLTTPSVAFFDKNDIVVGKEAVKAAEFEPELAAQFAKRDMGERDYHKSIGGLHMPPEVIQALILKKLRADAELKLGPIKQVVITVPAYFNEPRRKATQDAGRLAGLDVLDIINEPTAAAISYGVQKGFIDESGQTTETETVLVYDLGGGTFDVTIMQIDGQKYNTLGTAGDVQLGGIDWDQRIVDFVAEKWEEEYGVDPREDPCGLQTLMGEARDAKHTLSARESTNIMFAHDGRRLRVELTREEFEERTGDLLDRTMLTISKAMREAKLTWKDISRLLLVGGSSRMPMVKNALEEESGLEVDRSLSPDEAVAHGAAIFAGLLLRQGNIAEQGMAVKNVNSHDLGVLATDPKTGLKRRRILIPRNTGLPATGKARFVTKQKNQRHVVVNVIEGGDSAGNHATDIGRCVVSALPKDLPAKTPVFVRFHYSDNGRLTVEAKLEGAEKKARMTIERASGLDEKQLAEWADKIAKGKLL